MLRKKPEAGESRLRWFYRVLIFLAIIPIQALLLEKVRFAGVKPDFPLVFVFVQGWVWGEKAGLYWGLALGGLVDLFSIGAFGVSFALKGAVGFLSGILGKSFLHLSLQSYVIIFLLVSILHDFTGSFYVHGIGLETFRAVRVGEILIRAIYNTLLSLGCILFIWGKRGNGLGEYGGAIFSSRKKPGTGA